ncbi:MAG TPA: UvrD-helicase domain-containing protein [Myxococcota bacterium]|nr:UvrD-helicase domain-containing protein [Myxococcota bacterium]
MTEQDLEGLNPEQREAVLHTEGPLLVLAGAGSGKTRVLTTRIAWLIGSLGIAPEGILAVTFTNKAAGEMRERVEKLCGDAAAGVWLATFHSICVRILRRDISHLGYARGFSIYDEADSLGVVKESLRRHDIDPKAEDPRRLRWRIDQWKNAGVLPHQAEASAGDFEERRTAALYATYQKLLAEAGALDFNDLLLLTVQLFERFPDVLGWYRRRFQYLMVDEYQDTNRVQYRLIHQLAGEHRNLCVVGDPDQSIYAWRGADIRNILDFERDYPDATVVKLERNYRSTAPILEGASGVVAHNIARRARGLYTEREGGAPIRLFEAQDDREEAQFVVREIVSAVREQGRRFGDFAIFYRTNAQSRIFEEQLLDYNVPYVVVGGVRFYDRAEVKDALAYLRLLRQPADSAALRRIVNKPARGIGKTTVEAAEREAESQGVPLLEGLKRFADSEAGARVAPKVARFVELLARLTHEIQSASPSEAIARVLDRTGYLADLEREGGPEAEARLENLRELVAAAQDFERANAEIRDEERSLLDLFLDQVALVSDLDEYDRRDEVVSLMTAHSAKGLEYPVVYLSGMEEGVFPHAGALRDDAGLEEERRLCYVGMTRAMEKLTISFAQQRLRFGSRTFGMPSRFLDEIPPDVVERVRPRSSHATPPSARQRGTPGERAYDYSYAQESHAEGMVVPGLRVRHPHFGTGVVLAVSGQGAGQKLKVRFERAGVKTLVLRYANLELG